MNPVLMAGVKIVMLALICYTVGILKQQRTGMATAGVIRWLTGGVFFDVTSTALMMAGAEGSWLSLHGWLGFSALAAMATETGLAFGHRRAHGDAPLPRGQILYARLAYAWWIVAFVSGGAIAVSQRVAG